MPYAQALGRSTTRGEPRDAGARRARRAVCCRRTRAAKARLRRSRSGRRRGSSGAARCFPTICCEAHRRRRTCLRDRRDLPEDDAVADLLARQRPAAGAAAAMGSTSLPARRHPGQSRSRDDGAFARGAVPAARSPRRRARGAAAVAAAWRRATSTKRLFGTSSRRGCPPRRSTRPKTGLRRPAAPVVPRRVDRLGARDPARSAHASSAAGPTAARSRACSRSTKPVSAITRSGSGRSSAWSCGRGSTSTRAASRERGVRVTMLVRCLAMMRGGGETRHLAWARELDALGVERRDHRRASAAVRRPRAIRSTTCPVDAAALALCARLRLPPSAPARVRPPDDDGAACRRRMVLPGGVAAHRGGPATARHRARACAASGGAASRSATFRS